METGISLKTLVLGASTKADRYSYKAAKSLLAHGHEPVLLGGREGELFGLPILKGRPQIEGIHTITLYINPKRQEDYLDYLMALNPKRIIFNPGTENPTLWEKAKASGIEVKEACTLVLLSTEQFVPQQAA